MKYSSLIKGVLAKEFDTPSEEFVRFILANIYDGQKNQRVIDKFTPLVKRAFSSFVNELVNNKISSALTIDTEETSEEPEVVEVPISKIVLLKTRLKLIIL